ncbi:uncharacterized protein LAESUDRAFT_757721 [Laetiporus sulphureus 93-53]|uniref:Uncharacterized protein n=1 Tax=Laetiporus sulphureus 93-53 TaxID=1314785 RepID=A0A165F6I1_9APHY|nr:uncharacterized protein LAESUDRAFT_757721 [Laetiporus sulphureus 93-53]KZT08487.1 hypothetical protein LAESUDRAFT_757721 [Laetiporus sulphureus 93-53]
MRRDRSNVCGEMTKFVDASRSRSCDPFLAQDMLCLSDLAKPQSAQQPTSSLSKLAQPKQTDTPLVMNTSEPPRLKPTLDDFHIHLAEYARSIRNEPFCFGSSPPQRRVMPARRSVPPYRLKCTGRWHEPGEMERKILGPGGLPPLPMPTPMPVDELLRLQHELMWSGSYGYASSTSYSRSFSTGRDWVEPSIPLSSSIDDQPPPARSVDQSQQPAPTKVDDEYGQEARLEAEPSPPPKPRISRSRSNSLEMDERTTALASSPELMRILAEMTPESTGFAEEKPSGYDDEDEDEGEEEKPWRAQERERQRQRRRAQCERQKAAVRRRKWRESLTCGLAEVASETAREAATIALDAAFAGAGHVPGLAVRAASLGMVGAGYVVDVTFRSAVVGLGYLGYVLGVVIDVVSRGAKALSDLCA